MLLLPRLDLYRKILSTNKKSAIIMSINIGSNQDGDQLGIAHLLEHMLLSFDRFRSDDNVANYTITGKTNFDTTVYTIVSDDNKDDVEQGFCVMSKIKNGTFLNENRFSVIKEDVMNEILYTENKKLENELFELLFENEESKMNPPVGNYDCVAKINFKDLCNFFEDTYRNADYKLALLSDLNSEYIKRMFSGLFVERRLDLSPSKIVGINEKKMFIWDFRKGLGIYIKLSSDSFFNRTVSNRVVEDMSSMVIEELLPEYIKQDVVVHCQKLRYSKYRQFLSIEMFVKHEEEKNMLIRCDGKKWLWGFIDFLYSKVKREKFESWKEEYRKYLSGLVISFDEQIKDITNGIIFGDVVFDQDVYIRALELVEMKDLQEKIAEWFIIDNTE